MAPGHCLGRAFGRQRNRFGLRLRSREIAANQRMKLTGAAILVSRGMKVLQAAPAAYRIALPPPRHHGKEPDREETAEGVPRRSALPQAGLESRQAHALTPRHEDLESGTWARDHPSDGNLYPIKAARCSGRLGHGVFYP
jgi:hypothetical protein